MTFVPASKDYIGAVYLKKTGGTSSPSVGTQTVIPAALVNANNPVNTSYPALINSSAFIANGVLGKRTPNITISAPVKPTWFSAALLNSLVFNLDSNYDTDMYAVGIYDGYATRVFDGCRCAGISLSQSAAGGVVTAQISFLSQYGDSQNPSGATSFASASVDPGLLTPVNLVNFAGTADGVTAWTLNLMKAQGYLFYFDGTLYAAYVSSGMFSGSLSLTQSPRADLVPSNACTINIGPSGGSGVTISTLLELDVFKRDHAASLGSMSNSYSLVDLTYGGNPAVCNSY